MQTITLFQSENYFIAFLVIYVVSMFLIDYAEELWGLILVAFIFIGINLIWSNFPISNYLTLKNAAIYLFIGFLFSLFRTFVQGRKFKSEEAKKNYITIYLKESIFRWWIFFPFSGLNWIFTDLYSFFYRTFGKIYEKIFNL